MNISNIISTIALVDFSQLDNIKTYKHRKQCERHRKTRKDESK